MERINSDGFTHLCSSQLGKRMGLSYSGGLDISGIYLCKGPMAKESGRMADISTRGLKIEL